MIQQLRIYDLVEDNRSAFMARFLDHASRIMCRYGFQMSGCWEHRAEERTQFIYLLSWPDEGTMQAAWQAFIHDKEWLEIKKSTAERFGDLVAAIEDRTLTPVDLAGSTPRT